MRYDIYFWIPFHLTDLSDTRKTENNKSGKSSLPPTEKPATELLSKAVELGATSPAPEKPRIPPAAAKKVKLSGPLTILFDQLRCAFVMNFQ